MLWLKHEDLSAIDIPCNVLTVAKLYSRKGLDVLLQVLRKVKNDVAGTVLLLLVTVLKMLV